MRLRLLGAVLGPAGPFRYLAGVAVDEKDVETMAVCRRSRITTRPEIRNGIQNGWCELRDSGWGMGGGVSRKSL